MYLKPFGCLTKLSAKRAELVQKFVPRNRVIIFRNEHTRLTPLGPKLMLWCVSYYLGTFGTVWSPYKTRCKTGQISAKVGATKSRRNFSQECTRSTPLDSKLIFWCVLYYLDAFGIVWVRNKTKCKTSQTSAKVRATKSCRSFSKWTRMIHSIGP